MRLSRWSAAAFVALNVCLLTPFEARADWNQANDEANRQRMMSEMQSNAAAADRANEESQRRNQAAYDNRPSSSGGSSGGSSSSSSSGGFTPYQHHSQGPASVVASYSFTVMLHESEAQTVARISQEAAAGQMQSQYNLGRIYLTGFGAAPRDDAQARKWFEAAAKQGHAPAQAQYGAMLYNGQGGPADRPAGLAVLKQASDQGETYAKALYAVYSLQAQAAIDPDRPQPETVALLISAADAGEVVAQNALGRIVYLLAVGAPHDSGKVIKYLTLAAAQNDPASMFDLGNYYLGGSGVPQDRARGLALIKGSADLNFGDAEALYGFQQIVGGLGLPKDVDSGVRLLKRAQAHGSAQGIYYLGLLSEDGLGVPKDGPTAVGYYRTAAQGGIPDAEARYGASLVRGFGVAKDIPAGVAMLRSGAEGGSSIGQNILGRLYGEGVGVPKDTTQQFLWLRKAAAQGDADAAEQLKALNSANTP